VEHNISPAETSLVLARIPRVLSADFRDSLPVAAFRQQDPQGSRAG